MLPSRSNARRRRRRRRRRTVLLPALAAVFRTLLQCSHNLSSQIHAFVPTSHSLSHHQRHHSSTYGAIDLSSGISLSHHHTPTQTHLRLNSSKYDTIDLSSDQDVTTVALPDIHVTSQKEKALGVLVLLTVPLAWGTYAPVVKFVYEMDPPVPGFLFSTVYYMVASFSLLLLMNVKGDENNNDTGTVGQVDVSPSPTLPLQGGLELGSYLFLGNCLQVVGLETVPADRAAFLVQLTTIMVPLAQAAFARDLFAISAKTWLACLLAFGGVIVMGFDGRNLNTSLENGSSSMMTSLSAIADTFSGGDILIILAAMAYTMHVVRLGRYAQYTTPLKLAASKATVEAIMSVALILALLCANGGFFGNDVPEFISMTGNEIATYISTFDDSLAAADTSILLPALGACLWTGWVTCAYTIYAQSFGQSRVSPTDANLIYTTQPIFSSLFAFFLLGETLGAAGLAGGSLIAAALWLITTSGNDNE